MISWQQYEEREKIKEFTYREQQKKLNKPNDRSKQLDYNWFDAMDNCGKENGQEKFTDTSPAARICDRPGSKSKP